MLVNILFKKINVFIFFIFAYIEPMVYTIRFNNDFMSVKFIVQKNMINNDFIFEVCNFFSHNFDSLDIPVIIFTNNWSFVMNSFNISHVFLIILFTNPFI